jgi:carbon storage regulator CsrA
MLTRKEGQSIFIGENVTIVVTKIIDGKRVRIGIEAPKDIKIRRDDAKFLKENKIRKCPDDKN